MTGSPQKRFNPLDYCFAWTPDGWYQWDYKAAHKAALSDRNAKARSLRAQGKRVKCSSSPNALMSRGGIGSGHPHLEFYVTVYHLDVM